MRSAGKTGGAGAGRGRDRGGQGRRPPGEERAAGAREADEGVPAVPRRSQGVLGRGGAEEGSRRGRRRCNWRRGWGKEKETAGCFVN